MLWSTEGTLARHSTISLTMDQYSHMALADQSAALDALPPIKQLPTEKVASDATRSNAGETAQHLAQHSECRGVRDDAIPFTTVTGGRRACRRRSQLR